MSSPRHQRTLGKPAQVEGFGYWSGRDVRVEFRPAEANTGIVFVRTDLGSPRRIPAAVALRIETPRRTTLACDGTSVEMVEHIMAALAGLCIDNCEVWVDSAEMPGCDGSSQAFVTALLAAGVVEQQALRRRLVIPEITRVGDEDCWVEACPSRAGGLSVKYRLDYASNAAIGRQTLDLAITPDSFRRELASARTFLLQPEADWLRQRGLGARVTSRDVLIFDDEGLVNNELRFEDECVRHKTLDLVGDLALAGCDIQGRIVAYKSGHRLNAELVKALLLGASVCEPRRRAA